MICDDSECIQTQRSQLSELESWIAELSSARSWEVEKEKQNDIPRLERSSKFASRLGDVFMRTIGSTYNSSDELLRAAPPFSWESSATPAQFPVTITRTDILLLPQTWGRRKGAIILCQYISSPLSTNSEISLEMKRLELAQATLEESIAHVNHDDYGDPTLPRRHLAQFKAQKPSLMMYNAFKLAFADLNLLRPKKNSPWRNFTTWRPPQRNSFDNDINDTLELVHLWLCSGLNAEFYKAAFPDEETGIEGKWEAVSEAQFIRSPPLQRLRLNYIFPVAMEMISKYHDMHNSSTIASDDDGSYLNHIHEKYSRLFYHMASSCLVTSIRPTNRTSRSAPAFISTRSSDIKELKLLFDDGVASPYDRDSFGETILHEDIGMAVMSIEDWWYHTTLSNRLIKASPRRSKSRRLQLYSLVCNAHRENIDRLFNTIYFLLDLGLRLSEIQKEYRELWGYPCWRGLKCPTWEMNFPWKSNYYTVTESCHFDHRLQAAIKSFDDILIRVCAQSDLDKNEAFVGLQHSINTPVSWLPYPFRHEMHRYWSASFRYWD